MRDSIDLFGPYIRDRDDVVWVAWVKHVEYFKLMFHPQATIDEVVLLDKMIFDAREAFRKVPEFKGFEKPKHHCDARTCLNPGCFVVPKRFKCAVPRMLLLCQFHTLLRFPVCLDTVSAHAAVNWLRMGPLRGMWCFSLEGFHQRVKRISKGSNFRNISKRIVYYWCMQFAVVNGLIDPALRPRWVNLC